MSDAQEPNVLERVEAVLVKHCLPCIWCHEVHDPAWFCQEEIDALCEDFSEEPREEDPA